MDYNYDQVMQALRNAHDAGDTDAARRLAQIANSLQNAPKQENGILQGMKEFGGTVMDALHALPQFGGNVDPILNRSEAVRGPVEAAAHMGSAIPAFAAGIIGAGVEKLGGTPTDYDQRVGEIADRLTSKPKTELGEDLSRPFDELMYRVGGPLAGHMGDLSVGHAGHQQPPGKNSPVPDLPIRDQTLTTRDMRRNQGLDLQAFAQEQEKVAPKQPTATPFTGLGERPITPEQVDRSGEVPKYGPTRLSNDGLQQPIRSPEVNLPPEEPNSFGNMAQTLQEMQARKAQEAGVNDFWQKADKGLLQQEQARAADQAAGAAQNDRVANAGAPVFDEMAGQLRNGETSPYTPMGRGPMESTAMDLTARPRQIELDRRAQQMQDEVSRAQSLDFNAAERARQEAAPIPGLAEDAARRAEALRKGEEAADTARKAQVEQEKTVAEQTKAIEDKAAEQRQNEAQAALERRQAQLEFEVKRQSTADFNAQERARQLNAPVPGMDNAHVELFKQAAVAAEKDPRVVEAKQAVAEAQQRYQAASEVASRGSMQDVAKRAGDELAHAMDVESAARRMAMEEATNPLKANPQPAGEVKSQTVMPDMNNPPKQPSKPFTAGKQKGYILLEGNKVKAAQNLVDKLGIDRILKEIAPSHWTVQQAIEAVQKAGDVAQNVAQKFLNNFTKGGLYQALKTHHPLIRYVVEKIQEADRVSRAQVEEWVHGRLAPAMRAMNAKEQGMIWSALELADLSEKPLDFEALARAGATPAQLHFAKELREALDFAYDQINKAREQAGKGPIDKRTAYVAMRASGDYRRLVYEVGADGEKKVVGVIGSNFRKRLNGLMEDMKGKGYEVGEERYFGTHVRDRAGVNEAFMSAIEHLADEDPRVAQFVDVMNAIRTSEVYSYLNTKKHTMQKKGVDGMEGRKSWMKPEENALDGFKSQLAYMEATIKWGNLSKAMEDIKPVLDSPDINAPIAKDWSERYVRKALGFNPSEVGQALENALSAAFKQTGVGYSVMRKGIAGAKTLTNGLLLMINPRFWMQNVVQPMQAMPGMKAMMIARGLDAGFDFGTGYSYLAQAANTIMKKQMGMSLEAWERDAATYAKNHHVYGSDMVEHSNHVRKGAGYYVEKTSNATAGAIESSTRQLAFYAFVHMLKENGMSEANGLHVAAHNLTDMMMNNYSAIDRPNVYNAMGPLGDVAVNLQSYKFNELSRLALFARHAQEFHSLRPLLAHLGAGVAFGGLLGSIAFDNADWVYRHITKMMGKPDSLTNRVIDLSENVGQKTGMGPYVVSHGVFSLAGMDMAKSMGQTSVAPQSLGEAFAPGMSKLGEIAGAGYDMATNPSEMNAKRLGHAAMPIGQQGAYDRAMFENPDGLAVRPKDLKGQVYRNDTDKVLKTMGFTGIHESVQRQKTFNIENQARDYQDLRNNALSSIRDEMYTGTIKGSTVQKYLDAYGSPKTLTTDLKKYAEEQHMSAEQLSLMHSAMSQSIAQRMKALEYVKRFNK